MPHYPHNVGLGNTGIIKPLGALSEDLGSIIISDRDAALLQNIIEENPDMVGPEYWATIMGQR